MWYYVKIGGSVFSSKDYLIMEQFVKWGENVCTIQYKN